PRNNRPPQQGPTVRVEGIHQDRGVGSAYHIEIAPLALEKFVIGPFKNEESPRFSFRPRNVDPPKSLVYVREQFAHGDGYLVVYLIQNYGVKTVKVSIRRTD
ncbi:MAG TPA: hypothetical protein VIS56_02265, partial [Candidatus Saccharimonadales bacterium]